jgi:DNA-directed RNA polymerase subunit RPC12/RpoP
MTLAIIGTMGVALGLLWWFAASRAENAAEFLVCRCDECGQKVRYASTKAGRPGGCPRCKNRLILPDVSQPLSPTLPFQRVGAIRQRQAS